MTDDNLATIGWPPRRKGEPGKWCAVAGKPVGVVSNDILGRQGRHSVTEHQFLRVPIGLQRFEGAARHADPKIIQVSRPLDLRPAVDLPAGHDPIASHSVALQVGNRSEAGTAVSEHMVQVPYFGEGDDCEPHPAHDRDPPINGRCERGPNTPQHRTGQERHVRQVIAGVEPACYPRCLHDRRRVGQQIDERDHDRRRHASDGRQDDTTLPKHRRDHQQCQEQHQDFPEPPQHPSGWFHRRYRP